ncbi:hypothetical protein OH77DRAFT_1239346 [Trametes cingulata]|nr:hypothetical protein OH77DRAFT_1239346 [Trametes cingulata]
MPPAGCGWARPCLWASKTLPHALKISRARLGKLEPRSCTSVLRLFSGPVAALPGSLRQRWSFLPSSIPLRRRAVVYAARARSMPSPTMHGPPPPFRIPHCRIWVHSRRWPRPYNCPRPLFVHANRSPASGLYLPHYRPSGAPRTRKNLIDSATEVAMGRLYPVRVSSVRSIFTIAPAAPSKRAVSCVTTSKLGSVTHAVTARGPTKFARMPSASRVPASSAW